jgi:UDP-N-acetylmuramoylalanine--D-glutamate ligase
VVAGNIGVPVLAKYDEILNAEWVVLELSSFMLEDLARFRPNIAAILNIAQDHVDRYASLREYAAAKFEIVKHCNGDGVLVKNADDPIIAEFSPKNVSIRTFSKTNSSAGSYFRDGMFHVGDWTFPYSECGLVGQQNIGNILAACTIAREAGVEPRAMAETLRAFRGLPHRMEHLGCFGSVNVYDDSKATNVHAVDAALRNFSANVVLILGGRDKGLDFSILRAHAPRIRRLVCYGECGEKLRDVLGFDHALYAYRFDEAVRLAAAECRAGDVLLLSPGCVSWDQFPNYEIRGNVFGQLVRQCFP